MPKKGGLTVKQRKKVDEIIQNHGYGEYRWMDPKKIIWK